MPLSAVPELPVPVLPEVLPAEELPLAVEPEPLPEELPEGLLSEVWELLGFAVAAGKRFGDHLDGPGMARLAADCF